MKIASSQTSLLTKETTRKALRRASSTAAVLAVLAAAIGVPVITPEPPLGTNPVLAIARADCPPDCGGGPGNGGTPSGPPGGGTEFVPPSMPAMPPYEPGRGQPPLDQNNGISIYNSAAPQPSQAAQPGQVSAQNRDGSYNRAANGEQQPINYNNAPNNQQVNNDWQRLSDQLNQQRGQQSDQNTNGQQDQTQNQQQDKKRTCDAIIESVRQQFPAELFEFTDEEISQADELSKEETQKNGGKTVASSPEFSPEHIAQIGQYYQEVADSIKTSGLKCPVSTEAAAPGSIQLQSPAPHPAPGEDSYGQYQCDYNFLTSYQWEKSADLLQEILKNFNAYFTFTTTGPFPLHEEEDINLLGPHFHLHDIGYQDDEPLRIISITDNSFSFRSLPGHSEGEGRFISFSFNQVPANPAVADDYNDWHLSVHAWGPVDPVSGPALGPVNGKLTCLAIWQTFADNLGSRLPASNPNYGMGQEI